MATPNAIEGEHSRITNGEASPTPDLTVPLGEKTIKVFKSDRGRAMTAEAPIGNLGMKFGIIGNRGDYLQFCDPTGDPITHIVLSEHASAPVDPLVTSAVLKETHVERHGARLVTNVDGQEKRVGLITYSRHGDTLNAKAYVL